MGKGFWREEKRFAAQFARMHVLALALKEGADAPFLVHYQHMS